MSELHTSVPLFSREAAEQPLITSQEESFGYLNSMMVAETVSLMTLHHLLKEDERVFDSAWCKTMIDDVAVLGQLVVTTESCIFLAKGREATPCVSVPLTELKDVSPALLAEEIKGKQVIQRTSSLSGANGIAISTLHSQSYAFTSFWTIHTLESTLRWLRYAATKRQEACREPLPQPRNVMSGSFSHVRPSAITHEYMGRERSSSAGEVQIPPSCLLSQSDQLTSTKRASMQSSHMLHSARERSLLSRSTAEGLARDTHHRETSPRSSRSSARSPMSPRSHPFSSLSHSTASIPSLSSLRKTSSHRFDSQAQQGYSRSPPSASSSLSFPFVSPSSPASPSAALPSSSSSSSALHANLSEVVHSTLARLRISDTPGDILMGECEGDAM